MSRPKSNTMTVIDNQHSYNSNSSFTTNRYSNSTIRKHRSLEYKMSYKFSPYHLAFLAEYQRNKYQQIIKCNRPVREYYECLKSLFMLVYQAGQMIASNLFTLRRDTLGLGRMQFVSVVLDYFEAVWNEVKLQKLTRLSRNIMRLARTPVEFYNRIYFVCRKVSLNSLKMDRIEHAFLNQNVDLFWKYLYDNTTYTQQMQFTADLVETHAEKLAYIDFHRFINKRLVEVEFADKIIECCARRNNDAYLNCDFTFEFLFIEELCFEEYWRYKRKKDMSHCLII